MIDSEEELRCRLLSDLSILNLPVDEVDVFLRPFSVTYYGRYFPVIDEDIQKAKIYIYPYENEQSFMDYEEILSTGIHEFCHHIQYTDRSFVRKKGVMHDTQFWKLYNHYINRAKKYQIVGGSLNEKFVG